MIEFINTVMLSYITTATGMFFNFRLKVFLTPPTQHPTMTV